MLLLFSLEDTASMFSKKRILDLDSPDHRTVFYFGSIIFKWALVQRRWQHFWIMFTYGFVFAWSWLAQQTLLPDSGFCECEIFHPIYIFFFLSMCPSKSHQTSSSFFASVWHKALLFYILKESTNVHISRKKQDLKRESIFVRDDSLMQSKGSYILVWPEGCLSSTLPWCWPWAHGK